MKLYYDETLNPRKACAAARYLGSPVEFVRVHLGKGEHTTPAFLAMNPNGKVPVLQTATGALWESNAIICRLAQIAGSDLWPADSDRQIEIVRWLCWDGQHFSRHGGNLYFEHVIRPKFGLGEPDAKAVDEAIGYMHRFLAVLDAHLEGRDYIVANQLSVADFAVGVSLPYAEQARIPLAGYANVRRWHDRLCALPDWLDPFPAERAAA
ncbi:glutathione S-transferase family protein [Ferrovibrio sp.]|uniref:glutathione S-transferase family protein n=1 Tax=Ferrovibrio sp. TaxID=1917215 RepID=UPI0035177AB3